MANLSDHFEGIAAKRLSAVEANPSASHQHEFNGVKGLLKLFGQREFGDRLALKATFISLDDEEEKCISVQGDLTWYESRQKPRSEHRLYYLTSPVTENFREGDLVIFGKLKDESVVVIAARNESNIERQLIWLFGLSDQNLEQVEYKDLSADKEPFGFAESFILDALGIEGLVPDEDHLEEMLRKFGGRFPITSEFSAYARSKVSPTQSDPDEVLTAWLRREEELFLALEKHIVSERLRSGFGKPDPDVAAFIDFSLSVQNRRKARMGRSLENHLSFIFQQNELVFSNNGVTELKKRPDFLFPGINQYHDSSFPQERLTMLAAKSTCKDRWRQVSSEAARIPVKHLITLEPGITESQTSEMQSASIQLVVPAPLRTTYTASQCGWVMTLAEFMKLVRQRQGD